MNYFELYHLPISLHVDATKLKQTFYELSRKYHPDFFSSAGETEQQEVLIKAAEVNKAFKVFSNADETVKYVLQLKNLLEEEEKYQLPNSFLMEVMELNENLLEAKMEDDAAELSKLQVLINEFKQTIYEPVKEIVEHYKEGITTTEELLQVKDYYFKKKYLNRILANLE